MTQHEAIPSHDENALIAERRAKLKALREQGVAFPNDFEREHLAEALAAAYEDKSKAELETLAVPVAVAGRIMLKRVMGKASFATLQDMSGRIQIYVSDDHTGAAAHETFKHYDLGDIIGVRGTLFKTNKGELSVRAKDVRLLTKAIRPLPDKFHGLADQELKYRQRYVDLIMNEDTRLTFVLRSRIIQAFRDFLNARGFLEVETPMMHPIPGGAAARPFITHHNALDMPLYLRIAPELYLKRLVVGGFERVFEINRNFRNEGLSPRHNPEFTMLEFYAAYKDYRFLMDFVEEMLRDITVRVLGRTAIEYQGRGIEFGQPFRRLTMVQAVVAHHPQFTTAQLNDRAFLIDYFEKHGIEYRKEDGLGGLQTTLFEETTEHLLFEPTFIIDYPAETSPLARRSDKHPEITERFELFVAGRELANGFSELNDPEDQAERFLEQARQKEAGNVEAMHYDADYIRALEYGLPPTAGCGIGIDRFVMLLTDKPNIRDVILFPHMRPES
ncbi:lysine--tRNA ligase [Thiobacter aerophilum]|uniref:Lysine--tRNA ligase n=1 Tax=Thiobacter aerophilum TaxID=3121275 RepID=A0ABV0EC11_9BURK